MGFCTIRHYLLVTCLFQIILTVERQVFDFLGYLWIPILLNLLDLIAIIFGFFGTLQLRFKYILLYCLWNSFWLVWNIFLISLYVNVGPLNHQSNFILKIDPDSASWWEGNGPGCKGIYNTTSSVPKLEKITGCKLNYVSVEVFQSSLQGLFTIIGMFLSILVWKQFQKNPNLIKGKKVTPTSLYSIEFSKNESRLNDSDSVEYCNTDDRFQVPTSPKPMTPRRVKRRSGITRSPSSLPLTDNGRNSNKNHLLESNSSLKSGAYQIIGSNQSSSTRRSTRSTLNKHKNAKIPLTNSLHSMVPSYNQWQMNGHSNPSYQQSSIQSLNDNDKDQFEEIYNSNNRPASLRSNYSNFHGARVLSYPHSSKIVKTDVATKTQGQAQAQAQVPIKRHDDRQSMRSNIFLINGPPPDYHLSGTTISNSETTI